MSDPFANTPLPASNDELTALFRSLNPAATSPALVNPSAQNPNATQQVEGGTKAGVQRVNANMDQTGVGGYLDANGRAVFTHVRDSSTGKRLDEQGKQVPALFKPFGTSQTDGRTGEVRAPEISTGIQNALLQIKKATSYDEAAGVYTAFQETISAERARLEQEAFAFSEQKLGIPAIMTKLEQSRAADRADPAWYPGIGDSPITQKIIAELMQARAFVDNEVKNFLTQNVTYKSLGNYEQQGKMYLNHVDKILTKEDRLKEQNQTWEAQRLFQNKLRDEDRAERNKEELLKIHEGLTPKEIQHLNILAPEEFGSFNPNDPDSAAMKKLKEASIFRGRNKDKKFIDAIRAESNQQLLALAVTGNGQAKTILLAEEARIRGITPTEVENEIKDFEKILRDDKLVLKVLQKSNDKDAKNKAADFNARKFSISGKPEEVAKFNQERISYAMAMMQMDKTEKFTDDVRTWKAIDPLIVKAVDKSLSTAGDAKLENVVAAYLDGAKDNAERAVRLKDFAGIMRTIAIRQSNSAFGMPDYRAAEAIINRRIIQEMAVPMAQAQLITPFNLGEVKRLDQAQFIAPWNIQERRRTGLAN